MPTTTEQILEKAGEVGQMVADHPAVGKYKQAQKAVSEDADARQLLSEFNRQLEALARAEQTGMGISEQQQQQLERLQGQIMSHIKIKALNLAQVEFVDLLRRVTQSIHRHVAADVPGAAPGGPGFAGA